MAAVDVTMRSRSEELPQLGEAPSTPTSQNGAASSVGTGWARSTRKNTVDLNYMHRPPTILPNYGKRKGVLKLKTNVPRVLLFDNVTQQTMLDVELSGLQSQQHKLDRELNMQAKSFLRRRQIKDRLLKNLTKVHHDQDYWQFEREYFGDHHEGDGYEYWDDSRQREQFLPSLQTGPVGRKRRPLLQNCGNGFTASRGRKRKAKPHPAGRWSAADVNNGNQKLTDDEHRQTSLPQIRISPPNNSSPSQLQQFSPPRKVGFRFQKTSTGVTRIFHSHHDTEQQEQVPPHPEEKSSSMETKKAASPSNADNNDTYEEAKSGILEEADKMPNPLANLPRIPRRPFQKQKPKTPEEPAEAPEPEEAPHEINTNKPTLDYRFQDLRRLLVKQVPPNNGFIELSPSFTREDHLLQIRHRIQKLGLTVASHTEGRDYSARSQRSDFFGHLNTDGEHDAQ